MHVLHLIDALSDPPCSMRLAQIADVIQAIPRIEHRVLLVGPASLGQAVASVGLVDFDMYTPVCGRIGLAGSGCHRRIEQHRADVICAWSQQMATIAHHTGARRAIVQAQTCEPAMNIGRIPADARQSLRRQWGVDEQTTVVALVGRSMDQLDAMLGGWVVGLIDHTPRQAALLTTPNCHGLGRYERMLKATGHTHQLVVDERMARPWQVLTGADLALSTDSAANFGGVDLARTPVHRPPTAGGMGLCWAMAAGLPTVAEQTESADLPLQHDQTGLLAERGLPRRMAQQLIRLIDQPELAERLGRAAGEYARRHWDCADFADRLADRLAQTVGLARRITGSA